MTAMVSPQATRHLATAYNALAVATHYARHHNGAETARKFGITRSQVRDRVVRFGKAVRDLHRLDVRVPKLEGIATQLTELDGDRRVRRINRNVSAPTKPPVQAALGMLTLLDLTEDTCRFPVTPFHARQHLFCGAPPVQGAPYCCAHFTLAYEDHKLMKKAKK